MKPLAPWVLACFLGLGTGAALMFPSWEISQAEAAKQRSPAKKKSTKRKARRSKQRPAPKLPPLERTLLHAQCPAEMVNVGGRFCIDRHEASVIDTVQSRPVSPHYPPHRELARRIHSVWTEALQSELQQAWHLMRDAGELPPPYMQLTEAGTIDIDHAAVPSDPLDAGPDAPPFLSVSQQAPFGWIRFADAGAGPLGRPVTLLPELPDWQLLEEYDVRAVSHAGVTPQAYTPGFVANRACRAANKRLCRESEWVFACKGENQTLFPYGKEYKAGACNVFRDDHPAAVLHGNCSTGLSDPRLSLVTSQGRPLMQATGATSSCVSRWQNDKIFDMVGNLDEWVDDPSGVFVGGFYSRNTRNGCEARVGSHAPTYFDYSLGFRCCADLVGGSSP